MNGPKNSSLSQPCLRANESAARLVAYLGPYLFWGVVTAIVGGVMLLQ